jgi:PAS domain S-box-containing protein
MSDSITEDKRTEEQIVQDSLLLWTVFESLDHPLIVIDAEDYSVLLANSAARSSMSREVTTCYGIFHGRHTPCDGSDHMCPLAEAKRSGNPVKVVHRHVDQEGSLRWVEVNALPIFNESKRVVRVIEYCLDITQRKRADEEFHRTFEQIQQGQMEVSALLDASRAILHHREFKDAARSIFDSCKELVGAKAGYVALLSEDGEENELLFLESGGLPCTVSPELPMPIRGLRARAYETGTTVYDNDFSTSKWIKFMPEGHVRLDNVLFAPLMIEGKALGLLGLANKQGGFTEEDARMATAFGELAAVALQNSRALESLEHSEERFRSVVETASDAVINIDSQGIITFWNKAAQTIFGFSADEILGKPLTAIMPQRFRQAHETGVKRLTSSRQSKLIGKTVELTGLAKDGREFPLELSLAVWKTKERTFYTGIARDVTQRKLAEAALRESHAELERRVEKRTAELSKANKRLKKEIEERKLTEEALRKSEKKYRALINEASDSIVLLDTDGNVLDTNKKALELFGYSKDEFYQKHVNELHPEEILERAFTAFKEAVQNGSGSLNDTKILRKDGKRVPVDITGSVIQYGDQKVVQGFFRDITERKLAEEAIRQAEEQYRLLVQNLPSVVYKGYKDWSVDFFDKNKIESLLGYKLEDFISRKIKWSEVIVEEDLEHASREFVQAMKNDQSFVREYRIKTKAGDILWIQDRGQIVCDEAGEIEYLSGVFFDITDHKHTHEALRKSEKELRFLSAELLNAQETERARFARELHDGIGQALSTMKVRVETLAKVAGSDVSRLRVEDLENLVPMIRQTIEEVRNTCMDLRPSTLDSLGILPTIDWFCREQQTTYPSMQIEKKIDIRETEVPDSLKIVIYRIMQEALNNAAKHSGAEIFQVSLVKKDGEIRFAVQDNGQGFDLEDLLSADTDRRGFGITSMKERAELSGGSFSIESSVGQGTMIRASWKV